MSFSFALRMFFGLCLCWYLTQESMALTRPKEELPTQDSLRIYLGWYHQFQFAGYYAALENGYFEEEGLTVTLHEFDETLGLKPILSGKYDYGIATSGQILGSPDMDKAVIVAPIFQQSPLALMVKRDSGIERLKDLEGKNVAVGNELRAMLLVAGVDLDKVTFHTPTSDMRKLDTYDAVSHYILDSVSTANYRLFRPIEYGVNFYGECLITSRDEYRNSPERVEKIRKAVLKGWRFAVNHPDQIIELLLTKYDRGHTKKQLQSEAEIINQSLILASSYPVGYTDLERWKQISHTIGKVSGQNSNADLEALIYLPEATSGMFLSNATIRIIWIVAVVVLFLVLVLFIYSQQLKKAVRNRTQAIESARYELEKMNSLKDRMLSVVSHDVRAPLNNIQGLIDLISTRDLPEETFNEIVRRSRAQVQEVNVFMDNILVWARDQLKGISLKKEESNLKEVTKETLSLLNPAAERKHIVIEDHIPDDLRMFADRETIKLVLRNLVSNAIKFCDSQDKITVSAIPENGDIRISVSDSGPGISADLREKLFGPDQFSTLGSNNESGTGLGLLLCKEFVERNGGRIGVESEESKGSRFWFTVANAS